MKNISIRFMIFITLFLSSDELIGQNWESLNNKAIELHSDGKYYEALEYSEKALKHAEVELGKNNINYLFCLANISILKIEIGNTSDVFHLLDQIDKSLIIHDYTNEETYYSLLSLLSLGYNKINEFEKAKKISLLIKTYLEERFGKSKYEYGVTLYNLATLSEKTANYGDALIYYEEAISIMGDVLGTNNPDYNIVKEDAMNFYEYMGLYEKVLPFYIDSLNRVKKNVTEMDDSYGVLLNKIGIVYTNLSLFDKAIPFIEESIENAKTNLGVEHPEYVIRLSSLGVVYIGLDKLDTALIIFNETINKALAIHGGTSAFYASLLHNKGAIYKKMKNYDKSMEQYLESMKITISIFGKTHPDYLSSLYELAELNKIIGQYDKAIESYQESLEIIKNIYGKNHKKYADCLLNIVLIYYENLGQFEKALPICLEALEISEVTLGKDHENYITIQTMVGAIYDNLNQYDKAIHFYKEALTATEKKYGKDNHRFVIMQYYLADVYSNSGKIKEALPLFIEVKDRSVTALNSDTNFNLYFKNLRNVASMFLQTGQYNKVESLLTEVLQITENSCGKESEEYAIILHDLGRLFYEIGDYEKVKPLFDEALVIINSTLGQDHPTYATILNNLSLYFSSIGQYKKALNVQLESFDLREIKAEISWANYSNLATIYAHLGQFKEAIILCDQAKMKLQNENAKNHYEYSIVIGSLAGMLVEIGAYDEALPLYIESLEIIENTIGKNTPDYGFSLKRIGDIYLIKGNYDDAFHYINEALKITKESLGENHLEYSKGLNSLAKLFEMNNNYEKSISLIKEQLEIISNQISNAFRYMSESEKVEYLNNLTSAFDIFQSFFYRYSLRDPGVVNYAFDIELMTKGMIMATEMEKRKSLINNENKAVSKKYNELIILKSILASQFRLPKGKRMEDIKEIENNVESLEAELTRMSTSFNEHYKLKKTTWQDVKAALKPNEVSIEFSSFLYRNKTAWTDSIMYSALIVSKMHEFPILVHLFEENKLLHCLDKNAFKESSKINNIYNDTSLYHLVWRPLEKYIEPNSKIYWSPSGLLNKINVNALKNSDTSYINEIYDFTRVFSTSIVVQPSSELKQIKDINIFGGMDYEAEEQDISKSIANINNDVDYVSRGLYIQDSTRSGKWSYLPGTKKEAENIYNISKDANLTTKLYMGAEAVEEQYKNLDGDKSPSILHIATHGFFFPDPKISKEKLDRLAFHTDNPFTIADNPMNRSGLLFSGSNKAWVGDSISLDREDGILTAYEASHTYLKNTELVVLSACETGLGDIKGSEGVYGLQRAFKMAGARYLMMSLWKVPDNATQEFMTTFYTELLTNKKSIRDAYNATQKQMQDKYRDEPYKWAGFVLME